MSEEEIYRLVYQVREMELQLKKLEYTTLLFASTNKIPLEEVREILREFDGVENEEEVEPIYLSFCEKYKHLIQYKDE